MSAASARASAPPSRTGQSRRGWRPSVITSRSPGRSAARRANARSAVGGVEPAPDVAPPQHDRVVRADLREAGAHRAQVGRRRVVGEAEGHDLDRRPAIAGGARPERVEGGEQALALRLDRAQEDVGVAQLHAVRDPRQRDLAPDRAARRQLRVLLLERVVEVGDDQRAAVGEAGEEVRRHARDDERVVAARLRQQRAAVGGDHADAVAPVVQLARRGDRHVVMAGEHLRHLPAADLRRAHALRDRAVDDEKDPQALVHV